MRGRFSSRDLKICLQRHVTESKHDSLKVKNKIYADVSLDSRLSYFLCTVYIYIVYGISMQWNYQNMKRYVLKTSADILQDLCETCYAILDHTLID